MPVAVPQRKFRQRFSRSNNPAMLKVKNTVLDGGIVYFGFGRAKAGKVLGHLKSVKVRCCPQSGMLTSLTSSGFTASPGKAIESTLERTTERELFYLVGS